ncbi:universal stress protein [Halomonas campisalis]|uniref:Universal stress protein n=1 Tax=Billgrantia campisalis TaxID=74661 RepID=A0ABS9P498_9GAMM|nr:universal stress protein [Halomonas campisalis]MCG6656607.1 universal stress protein [Halomonas campisalis]MDR5861794.1 universal stress protein [Halomonas campisalis]
MLTIHVAIDESVYSLRGIMLGEMLQRQLSGRLLLTSVATSPERAERRREALLQLLERHRLADYREALNIEVGEEAATVLARLASQPDTLLCLTSHGRHSTSELFLGSVAAQAVREAGAPVVVRGPRFDPEATRRFDTLMVCVDGSPLSEAMLPHAVTLARQLGARLQLLQVLGKRTVEGVPEESGHGDVMESSYMHGLARRLHQADGIDPDWEVLHGDPAQAIVGYLADCRNTLLAMTTHGRSGLARVIGGSVSHAVLHQARCPVAILRP